MTRADGAPSASLSDATIAAIADAVEPGCRVTSARLMSGGLSSFMTAVDIVRADGSEDRLTIRRSRRPDENRWALSIGAEFALIDHLHGLGLPVARPRLFDDTGRFIDQAVAVLDHVEGAPIFAADDPVSIGRQYASTMAAIHAVDVEGSPAIFAALPTQTDVAGEFLRAPNRPLDSSLDEGAVRERLGDLWPPPPGPRALLHGDLFPGNVVWNRGRIAAVIDWEDAAIGDPIADVAISRLDLLCVHGQAAADAFVDTYLERTGEDGNRLPVWELLAALRPAGAISVWAADWDALGRPDLDAAAMRRGHRRFVDSALGRVSRASPRTP